MATQGPAPAYILSIKHRNDLKYDVGFSVRGELVTLRLSRHTAHRFLRHNTEGTVGLLRWRGRRMLEWRPVGASTAKRRRRGREQTRRAVRTNGQLSAFMSYPHAAAEDADWLAAVLESANIFVWRDLRQLLPGDALRARLLAEIRDADCFVPLLDQAYVDSEWCVRELAAAHDASVLVTPVRFGFAELRIPPAVRDILDDDLGEPLVLDLTEAYVEDRLGELAERMWRHKAAHGAPRS